MEDYSGDIEYVVTKGNDPIKRPRIRVADGYLGYGAYIMDRAVEKGLMKGKKVLWKGSSREEATKIAKKLYEGGKLPKSDLDVEIVIPNRIVHFKSYCKYVCDEFISVPTVKHMEKAMLYMLKEMNGNQMFWKPNEPKKPVHTQEDIDNLPKVFDKDKKDYQKELDKYERKLKEYGWEMAEWANLKKALKGNVEGAVSFIYDSDQFCDVYDVIDPKTVEV